MARKPSARGDVAPFLVMDNLRRARALEASGRSVVHLAAGQPSTGAPSKVLAAAQAALASDLLPYTDAVGDPVLRGRIAQHYGDTYGVDVSPDRVVITTGSSGGFLLAFLAAFELGARVGVTRPGYPGYLNILSTLGMVPVEIPVGEATGFQPTPASLEAAGPLDALAVGSPSNPTGTMLDADRMAALTDWCKEHDAWFVSDELYHGLTYGPKAVTALAYDADAIVVNSFSKYPSMTGWRLGWLVLPAFLVRPVERLAQHLTIAAPTLAQRAAVAVFDSRDELDGHVERYARNRRILLDGLAAMGLTRVAPADGAFYLYVDVSHLTHDSLTWCAELLEATGLSITPGVDFDRVDGGRFVRLSFAGAEADMHEAVRRLGAWVRR